MGFSSIPLKMIGDCVVEKKRLLVGTVPPPAGGDATWAEGYLNYYKEKGITVPLVDTSLIGKRSVTVDENRRITDEIKRCVRIWKSLGKQIRIHRPDIVHMNVNCSPLGTIRDYISGCILKRKSVPFVIHCHCNIEDQLGHGRIANIFFKALLNKASGVIVINSQSLRFVEKIGKYNTRIIPNFIPQLSIGNEKHISEEIRQILFVGHIRKTKGVEEVLEAAKSFPGIHFLLAGTVTKEYEESVRVGEFGNNVEFLGNVSHEKVLEYLDESDVFLFPSYTEGFSLSLVEAMSRGVPCIATGVGANADMLEDKGGIIVPPGNGSAVIGAINEIKSAELRKRMSEWNVKKVKSCYTIDQVISEIEFFYKEVMG